MPVTLRFQSTGVVPGGARPVMMRGGSLTIGRGPENDLVLPDPDRQISKRHCAIEDQGGEAVVIDFSSNGTFLNYGKVPLGRVPSPLSDGDILTMGPFELLVSITPGAAPPRDDLIADPLPDTGAGGGFAAGLLPPLEDGPALAGKRIGDGALPDAVGDVDFLDSLLGPAPPRGPSGVARAQPGDDADLPLPGTDDFTEALAAPAAFASASHYDHAASGHDHFAPPPAANQIPDDWDDLLGGDEPAPAPPVSAEADINPFAEPDDIILPQGSVPPPAVAAVASPVPLPGIDPAADPVKAAGPVQDGALEAFLAGLGAGGVQLPPSEVPATMRRLGQAMRAMITGLREVLMTRASIKQEFRIGQTVIASGGNNPLKFSVSPDQAVEAMLRPSGPGWLSPDLAAEQALQDLKAHEVAMLTGMEAALKDLLARLDPARLEERLDTRAGIGGLLRGKKARYWELYQTLYAEIADQAGTEFHELFAREFARAYREQLERLK